MPLEPGSQSYKNALDNYITGNQGADYDEGPTSDDFYELADKTMWGEMDAHLRSLVMGEYDWDDFIREAGLDAHKAREVLAQYHHPPTCDMGREVMAAINEAVAAMRRVTEIIGLDAWAIIEQAREMEDDYLDGKEVEGL